MAVGYVVLRDSRCVKASCDSLAGHSRWKKLGHRIRYVIMSSWSDAGACGASSAVPSCWEVAQHGRDVLAALPQAHDYVIL